MQPEIQAIQKQTEMITNGAVVFLAIVLVDKIIGWVVKLRGNGKKRCIDDSRFVAMEKQNDQNSRVLETVEKAHDRQCALLDGQTLVLDRIYQGQSLQIKALENLNAKMDNHTAKAK